MTTSEEILEAVKRLQDLQEAAYQEGYKAGYCAGFTDGEQGGFDEGIME